MTNINKKNTAVTETTFYILLALTEPRHGYAVMQKVIELSEGTVTIGAGTLYGAFTKLQADKLIKIVDEDSRRKYYQITGNGLDMLQDHLLKLTIMVDKGQRMLADSRKV